MKSLFGSDWPWLASMAALTALEVCWWAIAWTAGIAPLPFATLYLLVAFAGVTAALAVRTALRPKTERPRLPAMVAGAALMGIGASLILPLKFAIPQAIPFWLDPSLAAAERTLFGTDAWVLVDAILGWAAAPLDRLYALWLPVQLLVLFAVMTASPSAAKSRAMIAYSIGWFVLGIVAATLLSSAGPIFYDRLVGGNAFAPLADMLRAKGAAMALVESDAMWTAYESGRPGLVVGISAVPSLHVAITFWMYLAARTLAPRAAPLALAYFIVIWLASVQLGWHYFVDGLVGALAMIGIWAVAGAVFSRLTAQGRMMSARPRRPAYGWAAQPARASLDQRYCRRYLDLLGSIYIYNEHRGYTAIDRVLDAVRTRWPKDSALIAEIEKHRADERKHYLMFRRWFERRGVMPLAVDRTCGHIDRFVAIMFRSTIDDLDPQLVTGRADLFERLCRVISLTEQRGHRQVQVLLRHPIVRGDEQLMKIFRIIEKDEPSHWAPYEKWLQDNGKRQPVWWERAIDGFIHSELLLVKLPILFLRPGLARRSAWADEEEREAVAEPYKAVAGARR